MRPPGLLSLALVALALAAALPTASAHADLQSADPAPNGHAPVGVTLVTLRLPRSFNTLAKDLRL